MQDIDSDGFNIGRISNKTVDEMFVLCQHIPFAVAFNSQGIVKYYVSPTTLKNSPGITLYLLNKKPKEITFASKLPQIWCINLERRPDRKETMQKKLNNINFFKAIDGKNLVLTKELEYLFRGNDFNFRCGVVGAALSHYTLWKQLLESKEDSYLIVEDDVEFCQDFMSKFSNAMSQNYNWEILYLGFTMYERKQYEIELDNISFPQVMPFDSRQFYGAGFFGYVINRRGVERMLKYIEINGINKAIDCLPPSDKECKRYMMFPHLIKTPCYCNESLDIDTDIQTDYTTLKYTFTKDWFLGSEIKRLLLNF